MSSNHQKTPVTFSFTKEKETQRFTLHIKVGKGLIVSSYAVHGAIQREIGTVLLNEIATLIEPETTFTEPFQALVLRVASLYTGYPLRKFVLTDKMITTWFDRATTNVAAGALDMPSVNVQETLRLDRVASEIYEVTCEGMYAVLTHDPEEVEFREEWMDTTTQMMLNAVFEIPKMWTSNINASGMVVRDSQTEWVWNYSPSTEILIIHVHDRANKKHSQWEVTRELAIHFTGTDRENGTHYRSFINHEGGRQWHVTRKVVVQRAFITELPAGATKGVFKQIKHILQSLQDTATWKIGEDTYQPNYLSWVTMPMLEEAWRGADGKIPMESPASLCKAYLRLVHHYDATRAVNRSPAESGAIARGVEIMEALYALLVPSYISGEARAGRFWQFWTAFEIDREQLRQLIAGMSGRGGMSESVALMIAERTMCDFKKEVENKECVDEASGH